MPWRSAVTSASTPNASIPFMSTLRSIFTDEALPGFGPEQLRVEAVGVHPGDHRLASSPATSIGALMPCLKKPPMTAMSM